MMLASLSKREKTMFYAACAVVGGSLFYFIAVEPLVSLWLKTDEETAVKKTMLQKDMMILNKAKAIKSEYKRYMDSLKKGTASDEKLIALLLSEVEGLARRSNVYITALKPQGRQAGDYYKNFAIEMELDTNMGALTSFLYELQNSPRILKIEDLDINAKTGQKGSLKSRLVISEVVFLD